MRGEVKRRPIAMRLLEKLGYGKGSAVLLRIKMVQWSIILFLAFGPVFWRGMDRFLTRFYSTAAAQYKVYYVLILGVVIVIWGFQLFMSYRESRAPKFAMEATLDRDKARLEAEGKNVAWIEEFRNSYRRQHFVDILTNGITAAVYIMYYQIWLFMIFVIRNKMVVMKGNCETLSFAGVEKMYLAQFLDDLPFKLGEIVNIYGDCRPNDDVMATRVMISLANMLHWALIIGVVGFIWGKQIKEWFLAR